MPDRRHPFAARGDVDAGLVEALRRADPDGAEQLVERYGDRLYRLALGITGVKEDAAEALVLHDVEGASKADIAAILGVDVPAVKSRVHRARLFVRKRLSEYFEFARSGART